MKNSSDLQQELMEKLRDQVEDLEVRWNEEQGVASVVEGTLIPWGEVQEPESMIPVVLREFGPIFGPPDIVEHYQVTQIRDDRDGTRFRARACQVLEDLPVYGATLLVFADTERGITRVQSNLWRDLNITARQRLDETDLRRILQERLQKDPDAARFEDAWRESAADDWAREHFPMASMPEVYLYPVEGGFHPVFHLFAYQPGESLGIDGSTRREIEQVRIIVDAATGEVIHEESTQIGMAYTDHTGDGLSALKDDSGNYISRTLSIVRKDSADYKLLDRLTTPDIGTYDAAGTNTNLATSIINDDKNLSSDSDSHWNTTTTSCTESTRRDAQQPEVDGHFYAKQAFNYYQTLGWDGFDDGLYGAHCPVKIVAHIGMDANAWCSFYTQNLPGTFTKKHYAYIKFCDGECDGTTLKIDFMACDPIIFAHEYQHAVTYFGAAQSSGEPGRLKLSGYDRSIHEGYSDSFACLRYGVWSNPLYYPKGAVHKPATGDGAYTKTWSDGTTSTVYPRPFRIIEYPRSTNNYHNMAYCDHYDDRKASNHEYFNSTMFSHLAFLLGQGGVHQRASRGDAEFIPVVGVGLDKAAEIFHTALTDYFDTLTTANTLKTVIDAARFLLDAAKDVGGNDRSCEYVMMRRALYAIGLYPYDSSNNKTTYGGEACMLPWTYSWRFSRPYIGFPALWWQSPDLFINNNGSAEYDADVGQENTVFARVRNIGDQELKNITVRYYFHPIGTNLPASIAGWHPCKDQAGNVITLAISSLGAGSMNFSDVDNPPASQGRQWYLDPAYVTGDVDHFCLRAVIECEAANHNNDCPNQVQSNIQFESLSAETGLDFSFQVANWLQATRDLDLEITHTLPRGFGVEYLGDQRLEKIQLQPNEPRLLRFRITRPKKLPDQLTAPFNGKVTARISGRVTGKFAGELSDVQTERVPVIESRSGSGLGLSGTLSGSMETGRGRASFHGEFRGQLEPDTGALHGRINGSLAFTNGRYLEETELELDGRLEPLRAVNIAQRIDGRVVGGISIKIKPPRLSRP